MTPADINPWLSTILSLIAVGGFLWNHLTSGGTKALKELAEHKKAYAADEKIRGDAIVARFQLVEAKVLKLEGQMETLPDRDSAHRLELAVKELTGQIAVLEERMKPIAAINTRLQEWALERGK